MRRWPEDCHAGSSPPLPARAHRGGRRCCCRCWARPRVRVSGARWSTLSIAPIPASLEQAGLVRERFLWVRGRAVTDAPAVPGSRGRCGGGPSHQGVALGAAGRGFGVVALDLADVPPVVLDRVPFTTWLRVQRVLEDGDTAGVVLALRPVARSAGGLSLLLEAVPRWTGTSGCGRRFEGLEVRVRARSPRHWPAADVVMTATTECQREDWPATAVLEA